MGKAVVMRDARTEFNKFRRRLLKENNIEHLICARCGEWRHSVHLHHIVPLVSGGENKAENLIPLCFVCHDEWDSWDGDGFDFGTFLLTPPIRYIRKVFFGKMAMSKQSLMLYRATQRPMRSHDWAEMYHDGEDCEQYRVEWERQNAIFNTYPYSDMFEMFRLYGNVNDPVVLEDLVSAKEGDAVLDDLKTRLHWVSKAGA